MKYVTTQRGHVYVAERNDGGDPRVIITHDPPLLVSDQKASTYAAAATSDGEYLYLSAGPADPTVDSLDFPDPEAFIQAIIDAAYAVAAADGATVDDAVAALITGIGGTDSGTLTRAALLAANQAQVPPLVAAALAGDHSVAAAAAAAVAAALSDATLVTGYGDGFSGEDVVWSVVDQAARRSWLEMAANGGPTSHAVDLLAPFLFDRLFPDAPPASGVGYAVVDSGGRMSELAVDTTGQVFQWTLDRWKLRMGVALQPPPPPRVLLPPTLYAVQGDTLQVFRRPTIEHPAPYSVPSAFIAAKGSDLPRFYEWTPGAADVGVDVTLTQRVYNLDGSVAASAAATVKVAGPPTSPAALKRVLTIGDSLTVDGTWVTEQRRRCVGAGGTPTANGLTNLAWQGETGITGAAGEGYFGRGGYKMSDWIGATTLVAFNITVASHDKDATDQKAVYLDGNGKQWTLETLTPTLIKVVAADGATTIPASGTLTWVSGGSHHSNIVYSARVAAASTPFWDPTLNAGAGGLSLKYWCDNSDSGHYPALIQVLLGWNSLSTGTGLAADHAIAMSHYATFLATVHTEFPSAKVHLLGVELPSVNGGLAANYGAAGGLSDYYTTLRRANAWNLALQALAAANPSFVTYVDVASQFDSENNMQSAAAAVNSRNAATETRGTNGVHPATSGYLQIADVAYRALVRTLPSL